jgi:Ni,Fe-hydrogenase III small subunit
MGVITTLQEFVELPQEAGSNCAAADAPNETSEALSLLPERMSVPVPVSVTGSCPEPPPVMKMLLAMLTAGEGRLCSAPSASTRP